MSYLCFCRTGNNTDHCAQDSIVKSNETTDDGEIVNLVKITDEIERRGIRDVFIREWIKKKVVPIVS